MEILSVWSIFCTISGVAVAMSLSLYLLPFFYFTFFAQSQNLREKYGDWAVVTGGSSGIGKALARRLAAQGINVVIIALGDAHLEATVSELRTAFPAVRIRCAAADLSGSPEQYMGAIRTVTDDVPVSMLFSNAGFLLMGFFARRPAAVHAANLECNSVAGVRIVHHFYTRMIAENIKGCIAVTSSAVSYLPAPFAVMYGASKAMLTNFATSLAIEADEHGIDVTVINPSYTHSNLYEGAPKVGALAVLSKFGWTPEDVAKAIFASVGLTVVRDLGAYSVCTGLLGRWIDQGNLSQLIMPFRDSMAPPEPEESKSAATK